MLLDLSFKADEAEISANMDEAFASGLEEAVRISVERGLREGIEINVNDVIQYIKKKGALSPLLVLVTIDSIKENAKRQWKRLS
jgi:hypothetical protein